MLKALLLIAVEKHFLTFCNVGNFSGVGARVGS